MVGGYPSAAGRPGTQEELTFVPDPPNTGIYAPLHVQEESGHDQEV
jgi:hypothetical protein